MKLATVLIFFCFLVFCHSNENNYFKTDYYMENGESIVLEAHYMEFNRTIVYDGDKSENKVIRKWYSIGHPVLIETESETKNVSSLFHFTSQGFYTSIITMSHEQKMWLIRKIIWSHDFRFKYIPKSRVISEFKFKKLNCQLNLHNGTSEIQLNGKVNSFNKYPLMLQFEYNNDSVEVKLFKEYLKVNKSNIQFECEIETDPASEVKNFTLKPTLPVSFLY